MEYEVMRVTAKGQVTIPAVIRKKLNIRGGDYLQVYLENNEIRLKKIEPVRPLSPEDPIWRLVGAGESGQTDISEHHDRYLASKNTSIHTYSKITYCGRPPASMLRRHTLPHRGAGCCEFVSGTSGRVPPKLTRQ